MEKNEMKIRALQFLRRIYEMEELNKFGHYPTTSGLDAASELRISQTNALNLLRRLWRQGLVRRKKDERDNELKFSISERGLERLHYLETKLSHRFEIM